LSSTLTKIRAIVMVDRKDVDRLKADLIAKSEKPASTDYVDVSEVDRLLIISARASHNVFSV